LPALRFVGWAFAAGALSAAVSLLCLIALVVRRGDYDGRYSHLDDGSATIAFLAADVWEKETAALREQSQYQRSALYPQSEAISNRLEKILGLVQRDFILPWYSGISSDPAFVNEVDNVIRETLAELRERVLGVDLVQMAIARVVPIITAHLKEFDQAERLVRGRNLERSVTQLEDLDLAIAGKYRNGKLHPAVPLTIASAETERVRQNYLRGVVERIVKQTVPSSQLRSHVTFVLIREIVACAVLGPIMQLLADPDTWNQVVEAYVCASLIRSDVLLPNLLPGPDNVAGSEIGAQASRGP
jgi:sorting nexin-25